MITHFLLSSLIPPSLFLLQYLVHHLLALSRWVDRDEWERSHIVVTSWALLQDSFHTTLNLDHPANKMAVTVLYLAVHCCKLTVPSDGARRPWWAVMCPGITESQLQHIAEQIMALYEDEQVITSHQVPDPSCSSKLTARGHGDHINIE